MTPNMAREGKTGITNSPFARNCFKYWPMIRWGITLGAAGVVAYLVMWMGLEYYTREEGEALKASAYTKIEAKDLERDVENNAKAIVIIDHKFDLFQVEQRYHTQKLEDNTEKLDEMLNLVRTIHGNP